MPRGFVVAGAMLVALLVLLAALGGLDHPVTSAAVIVGAAVVTSVVLTLLARR